MRTERQAKSRWWTRSGRNDLLAGLIVITFSGLVVGASAYQSHVPRTYTPDTEYTLEYNGSLWGNPEVVGDMATLQRLESLPNNLPYPPYYDASKNESEVRVGDKLFGDCKGNNPIVEIPASAVNCYLVPIISK